MNVISPQKFNKSLARPIAASFFLSVQLFALGACSCSGSTSTVCYFLSGLLFLGTCAASFLEINPSNSKSSPSHPQKLLKESTATMVAATKSAKESNGVVAENGHTRPAYADESDEMVEKLLNLVDIENIENVSEDPTWMLVVDQAPTFQIYRHHQEQYRYKVVILMDAPAATVFDALADPLGRPKWDKIMKEAQILEEVSKTVRIFYFQTNPVWPTSARDVVLIGHSREIENGRLVSAVKSCEHKDMPVRDSEGVVRMTCEVAGHLVEKVVVDGVEKTRTVMIIDGNPGGWLPSSVVSFVSTKALPRSINLLLKLTNSLPAKSVSEKVLPEEAGRKFGQLKNSASSDVPTTTTEAASGAEPPAVQAKPAVKPSTALSTKRKKQQLTTGVNLQNLKFVILLLRRYLKFASPFMIAIMFLAQVRKFLRG
ncbi:hypothetical protein BKA69DRAFT_1052333 [Paraphysoderma sedebokerense]|nr:hypothetical protein BKA69DRAFT_1052333 [Paraphysoderma sedebokerense]